MGWHFLIGQFCLSDKDLCTNQIMSMPQPQDLSLVLGSRLILNILSPDNMEEIEQRCSGETKIQLKEKKNKKKRAEAEASA